MLTALLTATLLAASPAVPEIPVARAYVTAYTWYDNTPPGGVISHPIIHRTAGGTGTYDNPITVAVGHSMIGGRDVLDWAAGARIYIPALHRYGLVEDTCGDGARPQTGPCHRLDTPGNRAPAGATTWIDVWIDGRGAGNVASQRCADRLTQVTSIVWNPKRGYPVNAGPISSGAGCRL